MVRSLILGAAVLLCLSSHCAADAVRKVRAFDSAEAKRQAAEKIIGELNQASALLHAQANELQGKKAKEHSRKTPEQLRQIAPEAQRRLDAMNDTLFQQKT